MRLPNASVLHGLADTGTYLTARYSYDLSPVSDFPSLFVAIVRVDRRNGESDILILSRSFLDKYVISPVPDDKKLPGRYYLV